MYTKLANIFNGRINRSQFFHLFVYSIILLFISFVAFAWISPIPYMIIELTGSDDILAFTALTLSTLYIPLFVSLTIRRFHDMGYSGWWSLFSLSPLIIISVPALLMVRGQDMPNKYGGLTAKGKPMTRIFFNTRISAADEANMHHTKKILIIFSILILAGIPLLYSII